VVEGPTRAGQQGRAIPKGDPSLTTPPGSRDDFKPDGRETDDNAKADPSQADCSARGTFFVF
jgi:hypothetical protein